MPTWIARRGSFATTPTPSQAPTTAAPIMVTSVVRSTATTDINTSASMTTGRA